MELEVPTLTDVSFQGIETYIETMKRAKEYGGFQNAKDLIFYSLIRSKKTHLYDDMSHGDDENLEKFGSFIRMIHGVDKEFQLEQYKSLKQEEGENALRFFNRTTQAYYKLRDQRVPSEFTDKIAIMENTHTFLRGLRNREIAKILSRNRQQIDFKNLGSTAAHYETVENQKWD